MSHPWQGLKGLKASRDFTTMKGYKKLNNIKEGKMCRAQEKMNIAEQGEKEDWGQEHTGESYMDLLQL